MDLMAEMTVPDKFLVLWKRPKTETTFKGV